MKAMILAAGRGQRLRPLTDTTPKPLLKVRGKAIIEYRLEALARAGFQDVVINVAYLGQQIMDALGDGQRYGVNIHYSIEPAEGGLETGGGIFQALPLLGDQPFLIMNADIITDFPIATLPQQPEGLVHLVLTPNASHHPTGDFCLHEDKVKEEGGEKFTFSGIAVYRPELFANCQAGFFSVVPLLRQAMRANQVTGEFYNGLWLDLGTLDQWQTLDTILPNVL